MALNSFPVIGQTHSKARTKLPDSNLCFTLFNVSCYFTLCFTLLCLLFCIMAICRYDCIIFNSCDDVKLLLFHVYLTLCFTLMFRASSSPVNYTDDKLPNNVRNYLTLKRRVTLKHDFSITKWLSAITEKKKNCFEQKLF